MEKNVITGSSTSAPKVVPGNENLAIGSLVPGKGNLAIGSVAPATWSDLNLVTDSSTSTPKVVPGNENLATGSAVAATCLDVNLLTEIEVWEKSVSMLRRKMDTEKDEAKKASMEGEITTMESMIATMKSTTTNTTTTTATTARVSDFDDDEGEVKGCMGWLL